MKTSVLRKGHLCSVICSSKHNSFFIFLFLLKFPKCHVLSFDKSTPDINYFNKPTPFLIYVWNSVHIEREHKNLYVKLLTTHFFKKSELRNKRSTATHYLTVLCFVESQSSFLCGSKACPGMQFHISMSSYHR